MNPFRLLLRFWTPLSAHPWLSGIGVGLLVAFGVANSQPCSIKWRGGDCALRLPLDQTWAGGLLWGTAAALVLAVALRLLAALPERIGGRRPDGR